MSNKHRPDLFTNTLNTMDFGVLPEELSDDLAELIQAVKDTGKSGDLTLKLTIKAESLGAGQVSIKSDVKLKKPQMPRDKAVMFMTPDNNLQREDPRQHSMKFEAVPNTPKAPVTAVQETKKTEFAQAK